MECYNCKAKEYCIAAAEPGSVMCLVNRMRYGGTHADDPSPRQVGNYGKFCGKPLTNADSIRAMSDEKLARFLASVENRHSANGGGAKWCGMAHALNWLQQPAEEDDHA